MNTLFVGAKVKVTQTEHYDRQLGLITGMVGEVTQHLPNSSPDSRGEMYRVQFEGFSNPYSKDGFALYASQLEVDGRSRL